MQMIGPGFAAPADLNVQQTQAVDNGFGGIASAFGNLGAYQMRQLALAQAARAVQAAKSAGALATGGYDPAVLANVLANGGTTDQAGEAIRLGHSMSGGPFDPEANNAAAGIGKWKDSPQEIAIAQAAALKQAEAVANIDLAGEVRVAGMPLQQGYDANGNPVSVPLSAGGTATSGITPAMTPDQVKGHGLGQLFAAPAAGAPAPQPAAPPSAPATLGSLFATLGPMAPAPSASPSSAAPATLGSLFAATPSGIPASGPAPMQTGPAALASAPRAMPAVPAALSPDQRVALGLAEPDKFGVISKDPLTQAESYGVQRASGAPAAAAPTAPQNSALTSPTLSNLRGEDYLQALEKTGPVGSFVAGQARAILANQIPYPTQNAATKPVDVAIMNSVMQADPNFDATKYPVRQEMAKNAGADTTAASFGGSKLNFNTAIGHLGDLSDAAQALPGQSDSTLPINGVVNAFQNNTAAGPNAAALAKFKAVAQPFAQEVTKYLENGSGTEADREALKVIINPDASPTERNAAMQELSQVLQTRGVQMARQFNSAMGPNTAPMEMLSPEAQAVIARVAARAPKPAPAQTLSGALGNPPAPAPALTQAGALSAPIGGAPVTPARSPLPAQAQAAMDAWDRSGQPQEAIAAAKAKILQRLHTGQ